MGHGAIGDGPTSWVGCRRGPHRASHGCRSTSGVLPPLGVDTTFDFCVETNNHSKRNIGFDLSTPRGRENLLKLVADADVFVTSFLEPSAT